MQRSVLHTVVAFLAAAVLMLQHVPIVPSDHGSHEHCIHCTENYCTMGGCDCGHQHRADPHATVRPIGAASHPGNAPDHSSAHASAHTDAHGHDSAHGASHMDTSAHGSRASTIGTTIKPCGTPPSGIITFNLDKFVDGSSAGAAQFTFERPSSARYVGLTDQLVINQIFRPPVLG